MVHEQHDSLEDKMTQLFEMKTELRQKQKAFRNSVKHLRQSIEGLENIIRAEVLEKKQTVTVGGIRAEYKPTVVIKIKRENDGE